MTSVNVYLMFNGNCEEAFNFYKAAFKKEIAFMGRFSEMPPQEGCEPMNAEDAARIMHVSLPISSETVLMGSDVPGDFKAGFNAGNNFSVSINTTTKEEADRLFAELSADGKITMPMNQTFWGAYFGMFHDKFGISWMVNVDTNQSKN